DQGAVDLEDVALEVGDADPYGRALEDGAEPGLGGVQRLGDHALGAQRGLGDGLLLGQGALPEGLREAGGHGVLQPRRAGPQGLTVAVPAAVQDEVGVHAVQAAAEGLRVGAVRADQGGADRPARLRVEGPGAQGLAQPPGGVQQLALEFGPGGRGGGHREDRPAPDRRAPAQSVLRAVGFRVHRVRPTPANPEKANGSTSSTGVSGRHRGIGTSPGSTMSYPSKNRAMSSRVRMISGLRVFLYTSTAPSARSGGSGTPP